MWTSLQRMDFGQKHSIFCPKRKNSPNRDQKLEDILSFSVLSDIWIICQKCWSVLVLPFFTFIPFVSFKSLKNSGNSWVPRISDSITGSYMPSVLCLVNRDADGQQTFHPSCRICPCVPFFICGNLWLSLCLFSVVATKTSPIVHPAGNTVQAVRMTILGALGKMEEQTG